jgi:glycosyltransferase involved in cell wall biosynthesis
VKLLVVCGRFPYPLTQGDRLRAFYHIKYLAETHSVTLVSCEKTTEENLRIVGNYCTHIETISITPWKKVKEIILHILRLWPLQSALYSSPTVRKTFLRLVRSHDAVLIYTIRLYPVLLAAIKHEHRIPVLFDYIDSLALSMKFRAYALPVLGVGYWWEWWRLKIIERRALGMNSVATISAESDRQSIGGGKIYVVPNGVEIPALVPRPSETEDALLFIGNMRYFSNIHAVKIFLKNIFPQIVTVIPSCQFYVVGPSPHPSLRRLQSQNVRIVGPVQRKEDYFARCKVFVAPIFYKTGIQNKVLEAMAAGLPVVTTSAVNAAIHAIPGKEILIADTPEAFARTVISLMKNRLLRDEIGKEARSFVSKNYSWRKIITFLNTLLDEAASKQHRHFRP